MLQVTGPGIKALNAYMYRQEELDTEVLAKSKALSTFCKEDSSTRRRPSSLQGRLRAISPAGARTANGKSDIGSASATGAEGRHQSPVGVLREVPERPLFAHVATHNLGSLRVLEKCGFAVSVAATISAEGDGVEEVRLELRD
ncbi:MAG: GNAT family N-acetyltransferase [Actinomycetota bacterium]|nr:GNAT family N-acetyltransferase [Actinomycetota bacterium]